MFKIMARPFAVIGISFYSAVMLISLFPQEHLFIFAVIISILCISSVLFVPKNYKFTAIISLCAVIAGVFLFAVYTHFTYTPLVETYDGENVVSGEIEDISKTRNGNFCYVINVHKINGEVVRKHKTVYYSNSRWSADYYDIIQIKGDLIPTISENKLTFDDFHASQNIFFYINTFNEPQIIKTETKPPMYFFKTLRDNITAYLINNSPLDNANELIGIMLGDKSGIQDNHIVLFQRSGIIHVLVVSGMHLVVLSAFLFGFLNKIRIPIRLSSIIVIIFILGLMALTGFTYSVIRAGIMMIIMLAGKTLYKNSDSLNSLGLALLIILLINPFAVKSVGFNLSFSAALGIIVLYPHLRSWVILKFKLKNLFIKGAVNAFLVSLSANLFVLPWAVLLFDEISVFSPIINALLYPFIFIALIFGYLTAITFFIPYIPLITQFIAENAIEIIRKVCIVIVQIPYSFLPAGDTFLLIWLGGSLLMVLISTFSKHRSKLYQLTAAISFVVLMLGIGSNMLFTKNNVTYTFFDNNVIISYGERASIFFTKGNISKYSDYIRSKGIKEIDAFYLAYTNRRIENDLNNIIQIHPVGQIFMPEVNFNTADIVINLQNKNIPIKTVQNTEITLGGAIKVEFNTADINNPVIKTSFCDFTTIISNNAELSALYAEESGKNIITINNDIKDTEIKGIYAINFTPNKINAKNTFNANIYTKTTMILSPNGNTRIFGE